MSLIEHSVACKGDGDTFVFSLSNSHDSIIRPFRALCDVPRRLELVNGEKLRPWLGELAVDLTI